MGLLGKNKKVKNAIYDPTWKFCVILFLHIATGVPSKGLSGFWVPAVWNSEKPVKTIHTWNMIKNTTWSSRSNLAKLENLHLGHWCNWTESAQHCTYSFISCYSHGYLLTIYVMVKGAFLNHLLLFFVICHSISIVFLQIFF